MEAAVTGSGEKLPENPANITTYSQNNLMDPNYTEYDSHSEQPLTPNYSADKTCQQSENAQEQLYSTEDSKISENLQAQGQVNEFCSDYVLEKQSDNVYLPEQAETATSMDETFPSNDISEQSTTENYEKAVTDKVEQQYTVTNQDTAEVHVPESSETVADSSATEEKFQIEECEQFEENVSMVEDVSPVVELPPDLEEDPAEASEEGQQEDNVKEESSITGNQHDQLIIQDVTDDNETDMSNVETIEIHTYTDPTEGTDEDFTVVEGPNSIEMTSSRTVQGEDGTLVTVETYRASNYVENMSDGQVYNKAQPEANATKVEPKTVRENKTSSESAPSVPKQRKTRKAPFDIPMHVLGVDISKPVEAVPNGRPVPKPRLGVKVPYRNLTSQIVSKAEIEAEIMERSRQKQEQQKGDITFARSLTQRLAKKIAPSTTTASNKEASSVHKHASREKEQAEKESKGAEKARAATDGETIQNDSDLLAILEGEGDDMPVLPKEISVPQEDDSNLKAIEREIALQQLQDLPHQTPKPRVFRGKLSKAPTLTPQASLKEKSPEKSKTPDKCKDKENTVSKSKDPARSDASPKRFPVEIEPQVKVNMVLKTYSRKRKVSEAKDPLEDIPVVKKPSYEDPEVKLEPLAAPSQAYVTKSSRVIKKKVIWDPAEAHPRSPKTVPKSQDTVKTSPSPKVVRAEDKSDGEKVIEKKVIVEKVDAPAEKKVVKKVLVEKKVSPKSGKSPMKPKKPRSEIDRLLMDEGAVKMLFELNNEEPEKRKLRDFYSVEKANKDIMKKANLLKNELEQNSVSSEQKHLRKKDSPSTPSPAKSAVILERKMSKDSTRSSVHTPPGSPFPQGSMLIRRRSSSSLSSSDEMDVEEFTPKGTKRKTYASKAPKIKKPAEVDVKVDKINAKEAVVRITKAEIRMKQYKSFTVKKVGKHLAIDLNYIDEKSYLTIDVLEELTSALNKFAKDKDCLVVTLTSSTRAFCLGLEYSSLVSEDDEERSELAEELAISVRDFLMCLLRFPKVFIACIQGDCVGLGVTMLPLFDMVIASDKATFSTPYNTLGCMSEAGFLLSFPNLINHGLAAELLFTGHKLTADDAFRRGLVTRLCWPEKYNDTLKNLVASISEGSKQCLESMKMQLRGHLIDEAESIISEETDQLIEHWTSSECQENFSKIGSKE